MRTRSTLLRPGGDRGSLAMALLLSLVGGSLAALLLPMVLVQLSGSGADTARVHALNAAQAGLDVGMAHIRAASDGAGNGDLTKLPCGPFTGQVGAGGTAKYQVTIVYYKGSSSDTCVAGGGVLSTPTSATLVAIGSDTTGTVVTTRRLQAIYTFRTKNANIAGGLIHIYRSSTANPDLCLDAGSSSPAAGTNVLLQACGSGSAQQKFAYNTNLTLSLVSSQSTANPLGMCLDGGTTEASGNVVRFQSCGSTTLARQQWSFNDSANFMGTSNGSTLNSFCFNAQTPGTAGSLIVLSTSCGSGSSTAQTFAPEASAGAGMAGPLTSQLVDFSEFGRCLDVTGQSVSATYLIDWPCKQVPNPTLITWNQKWALPAIPTGATNATGAIVTKPSTGSYCLRSPGSIAYATFVTVVACTGTATSANTTWTVYGKVSGDYTSSYRIVDGFGYCLQPDPNQLFTSGQNVSKIVVATCSDSTLQKWNADPNIGSLKGLTNYAEQKPTPMPTG